MGGHDSDNAAERIEAAKAVLRADLERYFEQSGTLWPDASYTDQQFQQIVRSIGHNFKLKAGDQGFKFATVISTAAVDSTQYEAIKGDIIIPSIYENKRWRVSAGFREGKLVLIIREEQDAR